ncbi:HAD family hydrolase [Klebsiella pneumoniae]|nr:HAD family hydrolase [Klebsiella pneumoniae]WKG50896.1 HAD family hydrolase [Klebsiella pneumoniae]
MNVIQPRMLSVFDFDGTLTRHDSFIPFLRFAFGNRAFSRRIVSMALPTLRCMRKQMTRDELKETLITTFLTGVEEKWVSSKAEEFCQLYWHRLMRPAGLIAVANEVTSGAIVTLCSASPEIVLRPFAEKLRIKLIGTQLETKDGILTGRISGHNCRCSQKIVRLEKEYGPLTDYHLRAWGDTRGDYEGTVAKLAMRQPFVLFKGLTFQKLCLPGAFRPGDHHNKMLRPGLCVVHASPQYL